MLERFVRVLSHNTFCISDPGGDVHVRAGERLAGSRGSLSHRAEEGLFYRDTRHLSTFLLRVDGAAPEEVSSRAADGHAAFFLAAPANGEDNGLSITRDRTLGDGLREEIRVANYTRAPAAPELELLFEADFADLFEARGYRPEHRPEAAGGSSPRVEGGRIRFDYRREDFRRATVVRVEAEGSEVELTPDGARVRVGLGPEQEKVVRVFVELEEGGEPVRDAGGTFVPFPERAPVLHTDWGEFYFGWRRSVADLRALSYRLGAAEPDTLVAAGLPWFMTLFGRDSLICAYQTLVLGPELARNTLRALARRQATEDDPFRDAEPGKILHELRTGRLAHFGEIPHSPYYGSVDATPLFLVVLHEYWRWTADEAFVRELESPARAALAWIHDHADRNGDGYADYETRSSRGIENQGWKDSGDAVRFADGSPAEPPIALCEVQGYVYDAWVRSAELAEKVWDDAGLAAKLREQAADLKDRFHRDYWIEARGGYYALALDGAGRQVDALTSNVGHLLWSGIVPEERAVALARQLLGGPLFSGWGIRTMAEGEGGYNPIGYHTGTVWPHDNSLVACGLYRYGFREEANRIAVAMTEAAPHFDYQLPEVFAGYGRERTGFPAAYPLTNSPQAWGAGTLPLLARVVLGLEPDPENRRLTTDPALPEAASGIELENVPAFGETHDVGA